MTFTFNAGTQASLGTLQVLIHSESAPITPEMRFWLTVGLAFLQVLVSLVAHHSNPDGTSAKVAYDKTSGSTISPDH